MANPLRQGLRRIPLAAWLVQSLRQWRAASAAPTETPFGFRMAGNAQMQAGTFEPDEVALVREQLAHCDRLVDVGANIGFYACLARAAGRPVLAVEPLAANLQLLLANLTANGWDDAEVVAAGLAARPGIADIFGADTGASLLGGWAGLPDNTPLRQRIALSTLDLVLAHRFPGERLLVKVDVEGAEFGLLQGAVATLDRAPAPRWLVEICLTENFPNGANPDYAATFELFFSRGYAAVTANAARRAVTREDVARWAAAGRCDSGTYNYLFTRDGAAPTAR